MSLKAELDAFRSEFMAQVPPEIREAMVRADMELAASGIARRALKAGDRAPDFNLPDARGGHVRLKDLLATGPVVLSFYRGGWCPYCNLELRALQQALPEITHLGAKLVAVSPQTPDESLSTTEKNALSFSVLSDIGSTTAKAFGIAYDLAEELRPIYRRSGHALPEKNGDDSWVLPIPATYVIDTDGTIALAFVDVDYRNRLEPAEILTALQSLSKNTKENIMQTLRDDYFNAYRSLKLTRDAEGVLVAQFHSNGGPFTFTAQDHTEFVDAFYRIAQDRANKIVILTGAGGEFIPGIDFASFGNVADPGVWSQIHDEGVQIVENIANIRVPVIAAVEGRAHVHSEYALLASVIVAAEGATFQDVPPLRRRVLCPATESLPTWSYRAGAGRAEAFLLNPQPMTAAVAHQWGVVAEVVPNGKALSRAQELARQYLKAPEVTRRNTRVHFIQPLKERLVREVGYGLSLEGASAAALVKSMQAKS